MCELVSDRGSMLTVGIGKELGCVQHRATDGSPPYFMAVADNPGDAGFCEFLVANTPTPVPRRFCLSMSHVVRIASEFFESGERSGEYEWEEI